MKLFGLFRLWDEAPDPRLLPQKDICVNDALPTMDVDFLVVGAGMAGMTAAAFAASRGSNVVVVEKSPDIGGTALLSGGGLVKPFSPEILREANPGADPVFADLLYAGYDAALDWIEALGVDVTPPVDVRELLGIHATVRGIDIHRYIALCRLEVESAGGWVVTNCEVERLNIEDRVVTGALIRDRDGLTMLRSPATLLATGGFQGSPELRRQFLGEAAATMLVRANPCSVGDGLHLARSAGGVATTTMDSFYGHAIPAPLDHAFEQRDFVRLSMPFLITRGILLDRQGNRFVDESHGYYTDARAILRQPGARALFIGDAALRQEGAAGDVANRTLGMEVVDRVAEAAQSGANVGEAADLRTLEGIAAGWGYHGVAAGVEAFNREIGDEAAMAPPRLRNRRSFAPPYFAMEVQPAITFPFDGIKVDGNARVLDADGVPVPGLFAAGADAGGYFCEQYCSGLAMAAVLARAAVEEIAAAKPEILAG